ncbi:glycoside hydrolase family 26 protein [Actinacidiphila guanduensis]|uniref:Glycosyl hydrolase family 26 n=1 Tax=Actinacidiphila guanduensis TaxID=310781 RepID=A0A1G9XXJ6_9ACTN|nr:glycosyl hydrolase [Actinacidiphila guanduensis]SDN01552.1 Glycosyl hydrolase family 26 [Actinacidiphila guanduensis]
MADRHQWWTRAAAAGAVAALLLSWATATALGDDSSSGGARPQAAPTASAAPAADATGLPPFGAFTDSGAQGVANLAGLQRWLGGTPVRVGHTYLPGDTWQDIEGDDDLLTPWADWTKAEPGRMFVLNVPMQQDNEAHLSDGEVAQLIRQGADGEDDAHFTRLAQRLVRLGLQNAVVVLGWEMNGTTYSHRCGPDPDGWKIYWNRIVAAMRAVPGQHFRFDFAPNRGQDAIAWTQCYPGDSSVDVIGMDSYDQPAGESFYQQVTEPYGLQEQVDFAAEHKKAISYPEWGLFRNGDDPDYMSLMLTWIITHHPLYQTLTDYCPHGVWTCDQNPESSKVYRALLYAQQTAAAFAAPPARTPSPAPTDGTCTPMRLTAQMRKEYASGEVCVHLTPKQRPGQSDAQPATPTPQTEQPSPDEPSPQSAPQTPEEPTVPAPEGTAAPQDGSSAEGDASAGESSGAATGEGPEETDTAQAPASPTS